MRYFLSILLLTAVIATAQEKKVKDSRVASFRINTAGYITLTGKHGYTVKAFITSK